MVRETPASRQIAAILRPASACLMNASFSSGEYFLYICEPAASLSRPTREGVWLLYNNQLRLTVYPVSLVERTGSVAGPGEEGKTEAVRRPQRPQIPPAGVIAPAWAFVSAAADLEGAAAFPC